MYLGHIHNHNNSDAKTTRILYENLSPVQYIFVYGKTIQVVQEKISFKLLACPQTSNIQILVGHLKSWNTMNWDSKEFSWGFCKCFFQKLGISFIKYFMLMKENNKQETFLMLKIYNESVRYHSVTLYIISMVNMHTKCFAMLELMFCLIFSMYKKREHSSQWTIFLSGLCHLLWTQLPLCIVQVNLQIMLVTRPHTSFYTFHFHNVTNLVDIFFVYGVFLSNFWHLT